MSDVSSRIINLEEDDQESDSKATTPEKEEAKDSEKAVYHQVDFCYLK